MSAEISQREHVDVLVVENNVRLDQEVPDGLNGVTMDIQVSERGARVALSDYQVGVMALDRSVGRNRIGRIIRQATASDPDMPIVVMGVRSPHIPKGTHFTSVPRGDVSALVEAVSSFPHRFEAI